MNKKLFIIFIMLNVLLISCSKTNTKNSNNYNGIDGSDTVLEENKTVNFTCNTVEIEQGYYIYESTMNGIFFIPNDSNELIPLCNRPDCKHYVSDTRRKLSESCNAYIYALNNSLRYYNNKLYLIKFDKQSYNANLIEVSKDGSSKTQLFQIGKLEKNVGSQISYIVDNNYVYVLHRSYDCTTSKISRYDLKTGKQEVLVEKTNYMDDFKLYGNNLFYKRETDTYNIYGQVVCRYDLSTKTEYILFKSDVKSFVINNSNNTLVYWEIGKGLYEYDLKTDKHKVLKETDDSNDIYTFVSYNGDKLFLQKKIIDEEGYLYNDRIEVYDNQFNNIANIKLNNLSIQYYGENKIISDICVNENNIPCLKCINLNNLSSESQFDFFVNLSLKFEK